MSEPQFFQTRMGRAFYDRDVPAIAQALDRIASALEAISTKLDKDEKEEKKAGRWGNKTPRTK